MFFVGFNLYFSNSQSGLLWLLILKQWHEYPLLVQHANKQFFIFWHFFISVHDNWTQLKVNFPKLDYCNQLHASFIFLISQNYIIRINLPYISSANQKYIRTTYKRLKSQPFRTQAGCWLSLRLVAKTI